MTDHVHGGHGQPGAVRQHADIAVELDQLEARLGAALLQRRHRAGGTALGKFGLSVHRRIVEHEFTVERDDVAIREQRQRVDFEQFGVIRPEGSIELPENACDLRFGTAKIETLEHVGNGCRRRVDVDVDQQAADCRRLCRGDFLDIHAGLRWRRG